MWSGSVVGPALWGDTHLLQLRRFELSWMKELSILSHGVIKISPSL